MLLYGAGERAAKEAINWAALLEHAGAEALSSEEPQAALNNKFFTSTEETVHAFLREARAKPCNALLRDYRLLTRQFEMRAVVGYSNLSAGLGSPGPSGLPGIVASAAIRDAETARAQQESRERKRGIPGGWEGGHELVQEFVGQLQRLSSSQLESATALVGRESGAPLPMYEALYRGMASGNMMPAVVGIVPAVFMATVLFRKKFMKK